MNNKDILIDMQVIDTFDKLNTTYHFKINQKNKDNVDYIMKLINDEMMILNYTRSDIVDMLIIYQFKLKDSEYKNVLWSCFGDIMVENLKNNISEDSIQCRDCGNRFVPNYHNEKLCDECAKYKPVEEKIIKCVDCGEEVVVDTGARQSDRCDKCYEMYRKRYKATKERERRKKLM